MEKNINYRKKLFVRFLKENNCYKKFCNNFVIQYGTRHRTKIKNIDELICRKIEHKSISEIDDAFYWNDTNQGHTYWSNINKKWKDILKYL